MQVRDFAYDIVYLAEKKSKGRPFSRSYAIGALIGGAVASYFTTIGFIGNPWYHLSGLIPSALRTILDYHSTNKILKLYKDPRMKEYGLEKTVFESNIFQTKDPTEIKLFAPEFLSLQAAVNFGSTVMPIVGHGQGVALPLIYLNHATILKIAKKQLEIGDQVKKMIDEGLAKEEIFLKLYDIPKK